ncbi:hypothetical protein EMIHUDRAFT_461593 [Emiliania huxleyi CCMP1516]|uniref:Fe2OG dioxygenase domain-containing protein n=2 Tax=Emiliania huxleyi TaxID=2903 RepID=A0A0D3IU34_EMIH1|nr:hypothetical protein EMIHUDRAFT_461593 [Emiliania huxleyi CCMP1516]EOD14769.1 hypothetical protein EMIHUDRAFT_461593 [Emiliania huxleyi CCMP1516]|eukprot:XP_005767198.1 hypothetical protein EMIHUDRAFT_461593 [Emiliania huxleyi CCMP1516]
MRGALPRLVPLALLPLLLHPAGALANEICEVDVSPLLSANASHAVRAAAAASLSEAFAKTGFASVVGHGVRTSTIETLRASAVQFFASDAKHAYDKGLGYGHGGYVRNAEAGAQLLGDFSRPHDLVESMTLGNLLAAESVGGACGTELSGPTVATGGGGDFGGGLMGGGGGSGSGSGGVRLQELAGAAGLSGSCDGGGAEETGGGGDKGAASGDRPAWAAFQSGDGVPHLLRAPATAFVAEASGLGDAIAAALELSLGVETGEIDAVASRQSSGVRLALYPPLERRAQPGQMRYGAHVDSGMVTVLSIDPANPHGLQVDTSSVGTSGADDERVWVDVPHVKGALVLNVGALLSRWTGGRWRASVHRVLLGDQTKPRLSIVTGALGARPDGPPFASFTSCRQGGSADLPPVRAAEFLSERVTLHRPEYRNERGLATPEEIEEESQRIRTLQK